MGLNITTSDGKKHINFSYISFTNYRFKILSNYDEELGVIYARLIVAFMQDYYEEMKKYDKIIQESVPDDLLILINHSDVEGELTTQDCKKIAKYLPNDNFKKIVEYAIENNLDLEFR